MTVLRQKDPSSVPTFQVPFSDFAAIGQVARNIRRFSNFFYIRIDNTRLVCT